MCDPCPLIIIISTLYRPDTRISTKTARDHTTTFSKQRRIRRDRRGRRTDVPKRQKKNDADTVRRRTRSIRIGFVSPTWSVHANARRRPLLRPTRHVRDVLRTVRPCGGIVPFATRKTRRRARVYTRYSADVGGNSSKTERARRETER